MVEYDLAKVSTRVRFPSPAPLRINALKQRDLRYKKHFRTNYIRTISD